MIINNICNNLDQKLILIIRIWDNGFDNNLENNCFQNNLDKDNIFKNN